MNYIFLISVIFQAVNSQSQTPQILSACFGLESAIGQWIQIACPNIIDFDDGPYDAMPITFSIPVLQSTLDREDFEVTIFDGTKVTPVCVFLAPADEPNECHTVVTIGYYGTKEPNEGPISVEVVGDLTLVNHYNGGQEVNAKGFILRKEDGARPYGSDQSTSNFGFVGGGIYGQSMEWTSGLVMLKAWGYEFTTLGEGEWPAYTPNHCHVNFQDTTHVIKILFNGGMSFDGTRSLLPDSTDLFTIFNSDGSVISSDKFLGLADLGGAQSDDWKTNPDTYRGDGDNYLDLCLKMDSTDQFKQVKAVSIKEGVVYPPRGTGSNLNLAVYVEHDAGYPYEVKVTPTRMRFVWEITGYALLIGGVAAALLGSGVVAYFLIF